MCCWKRQGGVIGSFGFAAPCPPGGVPHPRAVPPLALSIAPTAAKRRRASARATDLPSLGTCRPGLRLHCAHRTGDTSFQGTGFGLKNCLAGGPGAGRWDERGPFTQDGGRLGRPGRAVHAVLLVPCGPAPSSEDRLVLPSSTPLPARGWPVAHPGGWPALPTVGRGGAQPPPDGHLWSGPHGAPARPRRFRDESVTGCGL